MQVGNDGSIINSASMQQNNTNGMGRGDLSVNDFLQLLAAQLQNQDMMNPMKDIDFMGQMAQVTTLQVMQNMSDITTTSYAASLVGKEVTVAQIDAQGKLVQKEGVVTGVGFFGGVSIFIGDDEYALNQIMVVGKKPTEDPDLEDGDPNKPVHPIDPPVDEEKPPETKPDPPKGDEKTAASNNEKSYDPPIGS